MADGMSRARLARNEFLDYFSSQSQRSHFAIPPSPPKYKGGCVEFRLGIADRWFAAVVLIQRPEVRAEICIQGKCWDDTRRLFGLLDRARNRIESAYGRALTWHDEPENKMCLIWDMKMASLDDRSQWRDYSEWLIESLIKLQKSVKAGTEVEFCNLCA